jgi:hypothetical protein
MKIHNSGSSVRLFNQCLLFAFSPLVCFIFGILLGMLLGCEGNKCTHHIVFFELLQIFTIIVGVYGYFFTIPAAVVIFIIGTILNSTLRSSKFSYDSTSSKAIHTSTSAEQIEQSINNRINKKFVSRKVLINFIIALFLLPGILILLSGLIWVLHEWISPLDGKA